MTASGAQDAIEGALPGPLGALAQPITGRATEIVSDIALRIVRTDAFVKAWDVAVRNSHEELLAALDHKGRFTTVTADGIELDLGSTLEQFRLLLDDRGLTFLDGIDLSGLDVQFLLLDAPGIQRISDLLDVLDTLVVVLPIAAAVAGVAGLLIARRRSWAVAAGGLGALVGVGVVWLGVEAGRSTAVDRIAGGVLGPAAAESVVDHVTSSLATTMAVVAVVGVVLVVVGAGAAAVSSRRA